MASSESKLFAFLAYLLGIIGFLIVFLARRKDKFAMYHAKQSLVLFIAWVVVLVAGMIPFVGLFIIFPIGFIILVVFWILGIINALSGKEKPLPWIGKYGEKFKF